VLGFSEGIYHLIKFIHVGAAIVWVGGGAFVQVLATRVSKQNDPLKLAALAKDVEAIGQRYLMAASILVLLAGLTLVIYTPFLYFSEPWVIIGLVGVAATIVTGAGFIGPEAGRLAKAAEERGPADPEVQSRIRRIFLISRIDLLVLTLVVLDMVFKPGSKAVV
jgi:uncharacterized membrane protein